MTGFIRNPESYANRTVQRWHAEEYGSSSTTAIDVDLLGYCRSCSHPLYVVEASTRRNKPTSVVQAVAGLCGIPALLVVHDASSITAWCRVGGVDPVGSAPLCGWMQPHTLAPYLDGVRRRHRDSL